MVYMQSSSSHRATNKRTCTLACPLCRCCRTAGIACMHFQHLCIALHWAGRLGAPLGCDWPMPNLARPMPPRRRPYIADLASESRIVIGKTIPRGIYIYNMRTCSCNHYIIARPCQHMRHSH